MSYSEGLFIEGQACAYLLQNFRAQGKEGAFRILARNYRWRGGEIDIIGEEERSASEIELVFVEVRARRRSAWVDGLTSVGRVKQLRLRRSIQHFLMGYRGRAQSIRVDVLAWDGKSWSQARDIRLAEHGFGVDGKN